MVRTAVSAKLAKYRSKRDFSRTAEPAGGSRAAPSGHSFVVQQHAARRMHYDFRLELDGVLLSWAVPKGPSLSPTERRLAVRVENHPLDYADFEGSIPEGQYGGGTVVVWDRGSWQPEGDAQAALIKGKLSFTLHGQKLRGRWHLVRTRGDGKAESWLLFKGRDDAANDKQDVVAAQPNSVVSGRTLDQVAAAPERVWQSNRAVEPTVADKRAARIAAARATSRRAARTTAPRTRKRAAAADPSKPRHAATRAARPPRRGHRASPGDAPAHESGAVAIAVPSKPSRPRRSAMAATPKQPATPSQPTTTSLIEQLPLGFPLTNLDKVLYPDSRTTKGELIAYLAVVSEWALPQLANRPLAIVRCPEGINARLGARAQACFFQKHVLPGSPPAIDRVSLVETSGETVDYMQVHDMAGVVALAQLGTLEIHTWGAHADALDQPDLMVFDLDPDVGLGWEKVALAAFEMRRRLHDAGLESFVKTTGGKGLHVCAPIARGIDWDDFKAFSKALVQAMEHDEPALYTTNMAKLRRKGKLFLDYLRNGRGATFIAPYSPRARAGAPVAVPITWDELAHGIDPAGFTIATVPRRLVTLGADPWAGITELTQSITPAAWRTVGGKP